jgi:circadian clock protein KaiB
LETILDNTDDAEKHKFILFVSGMSVKSGHAIENLKKICEKHLANSFEIEIVDISRDKEKAVAHQIIAIPTLIRITPGPSKMILGDLSDTTKVLRILDITE